VLLTQNRSK